MALTIWVNRTEKANLWYWIKIALTVPAALLANVLRVLSLIGYREAFYPSVESPQLHYFLGLVWLLPFIAVVVPKGGRALSHVMLEAMQAASVVALLAPMSGVPGGDAITVSALICLAQCKVQTDALRLRAWLLPAWLMLAAGITLIGMESLWLPWLLVCPLLVSKAWILSPCGALLTAATHPLFGMMPGGVTVIWLALAYACWQWVKQNESPHSKGAAEEAASHWQFKPLLAGLAFVLPFIGSTLISVEDSAIVPPAQTFATAVAADAYEVVIPGQSEAIGLVWFNPSGNGRHHSMKVCMKYRGVDLEPTPDCADVYTDGQRFMREFYMQQGRLIQSYPAYIWQTFRPRSSPGVHLIFVAKCDQTDAKVFNTACQELAERLHNLCQKADQDEAAGNAPLAVVSP